MTSPLIFDAALWSYGIAALIFAAFAVRQSLTWRGGARASLVFTAAVASAAWAGCVIFALAFSSTGLWWVARFLDAVRLGAWLAFLQLLLEGWRRPAVQDTRAQIASSLASQPVLHTALVALLLVGAMLPQFPPWLAPSEDDRSAGAYAYLALLAIAILGLVMAEQLYRRTPGHARWAIKPLVIGLAGMFALDLLMYSDAVLFHQLDATLWAARGIADALVFFFVALAAARNTSWTIDLHVSRGVVFHSTAMLVAGIYLLVVTAAGYWVRLFGGTLGGTLQVAFIFTALLALAALALSGTLRGRLRVFIGKHFFAFRYDHRAEWLRFTRVLGSPEDGENLYQCVVRALADMVESRGGGLWLERGGVYTQVAQRVLPETSEPEPVTGPLAAYLRQTTWVIGMDEYAAAPQRYSGFTPPAWLAGMKNAWLVVPLLNGAELTGFVVLATPRAPVDVNWEVRDLLKTAGRQAASYLAQIRASEALLEVDKFDAFNRMSAFVVHDLKNLIAQLALLLKNAERHRDNPEFQRDMLETVEHAVGRMNRLMLQLRTGTSPMEKSRPVDLRGVIDSIARQRQNYGQEYPVSIDVESGPELRALAHDDRIERVIGHIVQNAVEACAAQAGGAGRVQLRLRADGGFAVVEIADAGVGMTEEFMRERLFRPFQTTKPHGMGIGMNESKQYINSIGGRIEVQSALGRGTRFEVFLPLAEGQSNTGAEGQSNTAAEGQSHAPAEGQSRTPSEGQSDSRAASTAGHAV